MNDTTFDRPRMKTALVDALKVLTLPSGVLFPIIKVIAPSGFDLKNLPQKVTYTTSTYNSPQAALIVYDCTGTVSISIRVYRYGGSTSTAYMAGGTYEMRISIVDQTLRDTIGVKFASHGMFTLSFGQRHDAALCSQADFIASVLPAASKWRVPDINAQWNCHLQMLRDAIAALAKYA